MTVTNTTAAECAQFLRQYNAWRRNFDDAAMPNPTYIGMMIDAAAEALERESDAVGKVAQLERERDEIGEKLMVSDYALKDAERQRDALLSAAKQAADEIRRCDYTPARSTLLVAIAACKPGGAAC